LFLHVCRDVIVRAVTGSGKTVAFAVPIIHILSNRQVFVLGEEVGRECLSFDSSPHTVQKVISSSLWRVFPLQSVCEDQITIYIKAVQEPTWIRICSEVKDNLISMSTPVET